MKPALSTLTLILLFAVGLFGLQPVLLAQSETATPTSTFTRTPTLTFTPTDTATPAVTPDGQQQVVAQVSRGFDDVNEDGENFITEDLAVWLGNGESVDYSYLGLHFRGVNVPRGATITGARLEFYVDSDQWIYLSVDIKADASGNSLEFNEENRPSYRTLTAATVSHLSDISWPQNTWNVLEDIQTVVQEVIDNPGWASGNALSLVIRGTSPAPFGRKNVVSAEADPAHAPRLVITYLAPEDDEIAATETATPAITLTPTLTPTFTFTPSLTPVVTLSANAQTVTAQVNSRQDDMNEDGEGVTLNANNIWIGSATSVENSYLGLRFTGISVPPGATIVEANLEFYVQEEQWIDLNVAIAADNVDNSPTFTAVDRPSGRALTDVRLAHSSNVQWLAGSWNVLDNVAGVVQAVIDRPGWRSGNAISFIIHGTSEQPYGRKWATSFNGDATLAPRLVIVYEPPAS
jgi:type IV pilus assembly protein PilY1